MDISFLIFAKYVEKRAMAETLEITLKQTISKELSSPATSATKLSGPDRLLDNINTNFVKAQPYFRQYKEKSSCPSVINI